MFARKIFPVVYLLLAILIFPYLRFFADNPDTFQYIEISRKYISGNWSLAVNGYWSPIISWLLMIPLLIFKDGIFAFKILQLVIGLFTLFQWNSLLKKITLEEKLKSTLVLVSIPFILSYALLNPTPDLLFMGLLFTLIRKLIDGKILTETKKAIAFAIFTALLFLTKAFGFPFTIALFLILFFTESKRKLIKRKSAFALLSVFFGISLIWISILSIHYHSFTISKAPAFNMSREVAPLTSRGDELPILGGGIINPGIFTSAWEVPGEFVSKETITLLNSPAQYIQIIKRNLLTIYYFDFRNQVGIIFIVLLIAMFISKKHRSVFDERWVKYFILFIILIYGGYSMILVHTRYVWINTFLMFTLSVYFLSKLFYENIYAKVGRVSIIIVLALILKRPIKEILFTEDKNYPVNWLFQGLKHPFETMWINFRPDKELNNVIKELKEKKIIHGSIASLKIKEYDRDPYTSALRLSLENNCKYFGQLREDSIDVQLHELKTNEIDFLVTWKNNLWGSDEPVYYNGISGIRVYNLR